MTYPKFVILDQFLRDIAQTNHKTDRPTNFKLLDGNKINNSTTEKTKAFQRKKNRIKSPEQSFKSYG